LRVDSKTDSSNANSSSVGGLLDLLKAGMPNAGPLIDTLGQGWAHYAQQNQDMPVATLVENFLSPIAKRHPLALIAGAVMFGSVFAWSRPWRWVFKPSSMGLWGPALMSNVMASNAFQSWLVTALSKVTPPNPAQTAPVPSADVQ
jgi:hypothetical protein